MQPSPGPDAPGGPYDHSYPGPSGSLNYASSSYNPAESRLVKLSQRPSKSCTECIRRKTRCDKTIPCQLCLKRGVAHLCQLESRYGTAAPLPSTSTAPPVILPADVESLRQSVFAEIDSLRKRVFDLEQKTASVRTAIGTARHPSVYNERYRCRPRSDAPKTGGEVETEDAATTLEFLALGLDRRMGAAERDAGSRVASPDRSSAPAMAHILPDPAERPMPESVIDALLPRANVTVILNFAENHMLWQHCCVFFPSFWAEVEAFWDAISVSWSKVEPAWVSLLYTVMGIAIHQMTDEDAGRSDRLVLPNALVLASEDALYAGQFLSRPTIWAVQTIAILTLCGHNVCDSDLLSSLLAVGIKTAQMLNLHSLGKSAAQLGQSGTTSDPGAWDGQNGSEGESRARRVVEVELGKRLWWALAQEDWFAIPFRGVWSIHPDHFDTPIPNNCHDQDLQTGLYVNRPDSDLTVSFKMRFSSQVSSIVEHMFRRLNNASNSTSPFVLAEESASKILQLLSSLPSALQPGHTPSTTTLPSWTQGMRHYVQISATHKILVIYRAFLAKGGTARERALAHAACVDAAETIIAELERGSRQREMIQALWTIPYHALAAAVVLAMDMIALAGKKEADERRGSVMKARTALERLAPTSRIARRGLQVIADLLQEADEMTLGKRRRSSESMASMVKKIKLPANEMIAPATPSSLDRDPLIFQSKGFTEPIPEFASSTSFDFSQEETTQLLMSLQQNIPDVGRLFDGSIGTFGWTS